MFGAKRNHRVPRAKIGTSRFVWSNHICDWPAALQPDVAGIPLRVEFYDNYLRYAYAVLGVVHGVAIHRCFFAQNRRFGTIRFCIIRLDHRAPLSDFAGILT